MERKPDLGRPPGALLFALFLSGATALLYQVVWQRLLALACGSDVVSVTIVVTAFLAGLGVGSLIGGFTADRLSDRWAVYLFAACNLGVAAFALVSCEVFYDFFFVNPQSLLASRLVAAVVVFTFLLFPTSLMGMALPLLSKALVSSLRGAAGLLGRVYGINTVGAGVGALVTGWFLIGTFGLAFTLRIGAVLSAVVGLVGLLVARRFDCGARHGCWPADEHVEPLRPAPALWQWCGLVAVSGFVVISLEVVWFRVLVVCLKSNAYIFSYLLFFFLIADAAGSVWGARCVDRLRDPRRVFLYLNVLTVLYAVGSIWGVSVSASFEPIRRYLTTATGVVRFDTTSVLLYLALSFILLVPSGFLIGVMFPVVQKAVQTDARLVGRHVGLVQVANILGNTAGGIVTGMVILEYFSTTGAIRILMALGMVLVVLVVVEDSRRSSSGVRWGRAAATALGMAFIFFPSTAVFWGRLHAATEADLLLVAEDSTGVAVLQRSGGRALVSSDGLYQGEIPFRRFHGLLGVCGVLVHPDPRRVLIVGVGAGGTSYVAGISPATEAVVAVEIVATSIDVLREYARLGGSAALERMLNDPRYDLVIGDGRRELLRRQEPLDVIYSDALRPTSSRSGLVYSREYFEQARARLADGGLMVQWQPTERVLRTFQCVFPYVVKLGTVLIGGNKPVPFDRHALTDRLMTPEAVAYLSMGGLDASELVARIAELEPRRCGRGALFVSDDINTDLFPRDEYYLNDRRVWKSLWWRLHARLRAIPERDKGRLSLSTRLNGDDRVRRRSPRRTGMDSAAQTAGASVPASAFATSPAAGASP